MPKSWDCYPIGFRLKAITNLSTSSVNLASHAYQYDNLNRRTRATREDASYWAYGYNDRDEVTSGNHFWSDSTYVAGQQFTYGFDSIGNRTNSTSGGDEWGGNSRGANYTANSLNQYSDRSVPGYLDILGSATNTATVSVNGQTAYRHGDYFRRELAFDNSSAPLYPSITNVAILNNGTNADIVSTNIGNLFLPKAAQSFSYDADGNLTNDGRWNFTWDAENRLTQMESRTDGPTASRKKIEFSYDQMGRRYSKKVSNWNGSSYETNRFYYDGWNLIGLVDVPSGKVQKSFLWGKDLSGTMQNAGGVGGLLAMVIHDSSTNVHFAGFDGNGNISMLMSATGGEPSALYEYSPFGEILKATGDFARTNPFRFSTKFSDDESDLVYYGYRYYSPSLGRWINRDPIEEEGGNNLYAFVANGPINAIDPFGKFLTFAHDRIIDSTFGDPFTSVYELSGRERDALKAGSAYIDKYYQDPKYSYMHAMSAKGQSKTAAMNQANIFVWSMLYDAADAGRTGEGLFLLGQGMHTIMDAASPEHIGFQAWGGLSGFGALYDAAGHGIKELFHSIPSNVDNLTGMKGELVGYFSVFEILSE